MEVSLENLYKVKKKRKKKKERKYGVGGGAGGERRKKKKELMLHNLNKRNEAHQAGRSQLQCNCDGYLST